MTANNQPPAPAELAELDLAVAKAEGINARIVNGMCCRYMKWEWLTNGPYAPTRNRAEAMRLLEKYEIALICLPRSREWLAAKHEHRGKGPTPAIAICRTVVAMKGGSK